MFGNRKAATKKETTMKKHLTTTAIALLAAATVFAADPGKPAGDNGPGKHKGLRPGQGSLVPPPVLDSLAVTADQKKQVDDLQAQFKKERDALFESHRKENAGLRDQMKVARESGDQAKIDELRKKRGEQAKPMMDLRKQYIEKLRGLLNADQQKKLDDGLKEFRDRMAERREGRRGPGEPGDHGGPGGPGGPGGADDGPDKD
jgi:Spy/CpxP family protein refolding chaperone